jgi:hypothetical protein
MLQELNEASDTQKYPLGFLLPKDERAWVYLHLHASASGARGRPLMTTDKGVERGAFLGAQVSGASTVTWTCVAAVTADQFKDGYLLCQGGFVHKIKSNTAGGIGEVITLTLYDTFASCEAITAGRYGLLLENPYANVREHETCDGGASGSSCCMGVSTFDAGGGDKYIWAQTGGPCGVIATPATLGDAEGEIAMCVGENVGDEVGIATGHGKQIIGHSLVCAAINWENENFVILDLCIRR